MVAWFASTCLLLISAVFFHSDGWALLIVSHGSRCRLRYATVRRAILAGSQTWPLLWLRCATERVVLQLASSRLTHNYRSFGHCCLRSSCLLNSSCCSSDRPTLVTGGIRNVSTKYRHWSNRFHIKYVNFTVWFILQRIACARAVSRWSNYRPRHVGLAYMRTTILTMCKELLPTRVSAKSHFVVSCMYYETVGLRVRPFNVAL